MLKIHHLANSIVMYELGGEAHQEAQVKPFQHTFPSTKYSAQKHHLINNYHV